MLKGLSENILLLLFVIILIGNYLGGIKWKGISLGPSAIFLTAVVFGHFGLQAPRIILELGLALFVYSIGIQVGANFFKDFRKEGLHMIGMAFVMTSSGLIATIAIAYFRNLPVGVSAGLFAGSLTNTPALAAAVELIEKYGFGDGGSVTAGYGITYPFAVVAAVIFVQILPKLLKRDVGQEEKNWAEEQKAMNPAPEFKQFRLENSKCFGKTVGYLDNSYMHKSDPLIMSRVLRKEKISGSRQHELTEYVATEDFILQKDDIVTVVGKTNNLELLGLVFGEEVPVQLLNKDIMTMDAEITAPFFGNRKISEIDMSKHKVIITRVIRGGTEFPPNNDTMVEFGDTLRFVGLYKDTARFAKIVSTKNKKLEETSLFTFVLGLVAGLLLGAVSIPIIGGSPLSLGPAGGSLIAGLFLSTRKSLFGKEIHIPIEALRIMQDLGLTLFMAGAGLIAGGRFMSIFHMYGFELLLEGAMITVITLISGAAYMYYLKAKTLAIMSAIAAGMTQPSALEVTKQEAKTELPLLVYASVYPFAMILKILLIQVLVVVVNTLSVL
ncbi:MAG: hypothetical protein NTZ13_04835 [Candidatus Parcubacteria bacterium]|nr:hypothetical protein [Candidatus Parcubacteria bacterium]